jgi:hypothetical protein
MSSFFTVENNYTLARGARPRQRYCKIKIDPDGRQIPPDYVYDSPRCYTIDLVAPANGFSGLVHLTWFAPPGARKPWSGKTFAHAIHCSIHVCTERVYAAATYYYQDDVSLQWPPPPMTSLRTVVDRHKTVEFSTAPYDASTFHNWLGFQKKVSQFKDAAPVFDWMMETFEAEPWVHLVGESPVKFFRSVCPIPLAEYQS